MLRSMTGYGRSEVLLDERRLVVEIRSYNHRFLDISTRIARTLYSFESEIRKQVAAAVSRGKLDVSIQFDSGRADNSEIQADPEAASRIFEMLRQVQQRVGMAEHIDLAALLSFKDVIFTSGEQAIEGERFLRTLQSGLGQALKALQEMQEAEGTAIARDISQRMQAIERLADDVGTRAPAVLETRAQALKERIKNLCAEVTIDEARMLQEIAILADRSDITEELVRARSHIHQFVLWIGASESIGRKLDFLIQEINREINTIGSKASDSDISLLVVAIKNELEKIREQVQNVM
jgi:uncharacterized protein (TIGR00255 family)